MADSSLQRVAVIGASGYGGMQSVRLLHDHPHFQVSFLGGARSAGTHWQALNPFMTPGPDLVVQAPDPAAIAAAADAAVLSLPNGLAATMVPVLLEHGVRVLDLSADYRFADLATWRSIYSDHVSGKPASARQDGALCAEAVYGLPEWQGAAIARARLVGCPGCFPTASLIALMPLLQDQLVDPGSIVIDAKTGTSGGGRDAREHLLLAEAGEAVAPYGVGGHRHRGEIETQATIMAGGQPIVLQFTPHLLPMVRGLLATVYARLREPIPSAANLTTLFRSTYADHPCVQVLAAGTYPSTKWVRQTNRALLSVETDPRTGQVVVMVALDNLVKGQAGQALQCLNIMAGLPGDLGLPMLPFYP